MTEQDGQTIPFLGICGELLPGFGGKRERVHEADRAVGAQVAVDQLFLREDRNVEDDLATLGLDLQRKDLASRLHPRRRDNEHGPIRLDFDGKVPHVVEGQAIFTDEADNPLRGAAGELVHDELDLLRSAGVKLHRLLAAELGSGEDHFAVADDGERGVGMFEQKLDGLGPAHAGGMDLGLDDELSLRRQNLAGKMQVAKRKVLWPLAADVDDVKLHLGMIGESLLDFRGLRGFPGGLGKVAKDVDFLAGLLLLLNKLHRSGEHFHQRARRAGGTEPLDGLLGSGPIDGKAGGSGARIHHGHFAVPRQLLDEPGRRLLRHLQPPLVVLAELHAGGSINDQHRGHRRFLVPQHRLAADKGPNAGEENDRAEERGQ